MAFKDRTDFIFKELRRLVDALVIGGMRPSAGPAPCARPTWPSYTRDSIRLTIM
jgi:hypothetical protein